MNMGQDNISKDVKLDNNKSFMYGSGDHIWFTSDTHFSHDNIIRFCNRPFKDVNHMNEVLIENWNSLVQPEDTVFHLGDFAWGGSDVWNKILQRLNGHIHLIVGNHDEKNLRQGYMKYFDSISYQKHIYIERKSIYLNHYPFLAFGGAYRGEGATWQLFGGVNPSFEALDEILKNVPEQKVDAVWELFGHVHSKPGSTGLDVSRMQYLFTTQYDVGVDNNDYKPVSFAQVKKIIEEQQLSNGLSRK